MRYTSPILVALLLATWCLAARPAGAQESATTEACVKCHVKPAENVTDYRIFHRDQWEIGVHASLDCIECHPGADPKAFDQLPHRLGDPPPSCMGCHQDEFPEISEEFQRSVHATQAQIDGFTCLQCHSPHYMRSGRDALPREERVREANQACIQCHSEAVIRASGQEGAKGLQEAHAWDPVRETHARMRCVVCHTLIDGSDEHLVVSSDQAIRSCDACHDPKSPLIAKYVGPDDPSSWVTNPLLFQEAYVPGATRNRVVDGLLVGLFWLTVCGVLAHALLRVLTRRNRPRMSAAAEKVKMYPVWLRIWHWSNAILFVVLALTGVRMHFGQRHRPIMSFETAFNVHNLAGILLVIIGLLYFVGNFIGRNQRQYLSKPRDGFRGLLRQAQWYLFGIFKGEPHPYHASPEHKFNPLQHLTYINVMYVMYPLILLSGVALLFPDFLPSVVLGRHGVWWVAAIHWILAAAAIMFLVGHLYLGSTGDKVRDLYAAMLDGHHRHRTREP
jgi:thiosulfate reductase cytochrome b subunit